MQDAYSGNTIKWTFSIFYINGIPGVKFLLLARDYNHPSQQYYYKNIQDEPNENVCVIW